MANLPKDFIGLDALQLVANEVSKEIVMGPGYSDAEEMDRLGIDIVTGIQFKHTFHLFIRKVEPHVVRTFIAKSTAKLDF